MRDFRKIRAWMATDDLTVEIYRHTKHFPRRELHGLTSQLRRAADSVPANIAEGSARASNRDYLRFLYIARASLAETQYFVHLSARLGYLSPSETPELETSIKSGFVRLHNLIHAVVVRASGP